MPSTLVGIAFLVFVLIPVYAAIRPRSLFSIRSVDDRKLSIDSENILWDGVTIPVKNVTELDIYLFAFENFQHDELGPSTLPVRVTEFGDQNKLQFIFQDKEYDFTFYIGNHFQYLTLLQIIYAWREAGYELSARNAFNYAEIQKAIAYYGQ
jgi:hypothetical protein